MFCAFGLKSHFKFLFIFLLKSILEHCCIICHHHIYVTASDVKCRNLSLRKGCINCPCIEVTCRLHGLQWKTQAPRVLFVNHNHVTSLFHVGIFGQKLEDTVRYEKRYGNRLAPMLVEQCVDFIRQRGLKEEGLFRLPGQANLVKELQDAFDCGEKPSFDR